MAFNENLNNRTSWTEVFVFYRTSPPLGPLPCLSFRFTTKQSRAMGIADHVLTLGDLFAVLSTYVARLAPLCMDDSPASINWITRKWRVFFSVFFCFFGIPASQKDSRYISFPSNHLGYTHVNLTCFVGLSVHLSIHQTLLFALLPLTKCLTNLFSSLPLPTRMRLG